MIKKHGKKSFTPPESKPIKLEGIEVYEIDEVEIILDVEEMDLEDIEIEEIPHARTAEYKNVSNRYRYNTRKLKILIIMYVF